MVMLSLERMDAWMDADLGEIKSRKAPDLLRDTENRYRERNRPEYKCYYLS
jgi:hypothetical protein